MGKVTTLLKQTKKKTHVNSKTCSTATNDLFVVDVIVIELSVGSVAVG